MLQYELIQTEPNAQVVVSEVVKRSVNVVELKTGETVVVSTEGFPSEIEGKEVMGKGIAKGSVVESVDLNAVVLSKPITRDLEASKLEFVSSVPLFTIDVSVNAFKALLTCRTTINTGGTASTTSLTRKQHG